MNTTQTTEPTIDTTTAQVHHARAVLAQWQAHEEAARAEMADLEAQSGEAYLSDPDALDEVPKRLRELRDRIDVAVSAQTAQTGRVADAESAWLHAQADALAMKLTEATERLDRHNATTAKLLAALEDHNGPYVTEESLAEVRNQLRPYVAGLPNSWRTPKAAPLEQEVRDIGRQVQSLRELAAGLDPREVHASNGLPGYYGVPDAELYPPCVWGPNALVPAPAYLARHGGNV